MDERTFIKKRRVLQERFVERVDADGVVTEHRSVGRSYVGSSTEEMLYIKLFQSSGKSLSCGLTGYQRDLLDFACNQVRDRSNQFVLIASEARQFFGKVTSNSAYHTSVRALVARQLIYKVSDCRYVLNPYYAAIGSNNEVKELRKWWDENHKTQPSQN
jgi:hypothetical protein